MKLSRRQLRLLISESVMDQIMAVGAEPNKKNMQHLASTAMNVLTRLEDMADENDDEMLLNDIGALKIRLGSIWRYIDDGVTP